MEIKNLQIIQFYNLYQQLSIKNLPLALAYTLRYNFKALNPAFTAFEESKKDLIEKYADRDKDGNITVDDSGNVKLTTDAMKKFSELLDISTTTNIKTISLSEVERTEYDEEFDKISMNELDAIMFMIEG